MLRPEADAGNTLIAPALVQVAFQSYSVGAFRQQEAAGKAGIAFAAEGATESGDSRLVSPLGSTLKTSKGHMEYAN